MSKIGQQGLVWLLGRRSFSYNTFYLVGAYHVMNDHCGDQKRLVGYIQFIDKSIYALMDTIDTDLAFDGDVFDLATSD
jgi:hypothetical protein